MASTNAAQSLLELIDSWKKTKSGTNTTLISQRSGVSNYSAELWRDQLQAVSYFLEIQAFIDAQGLTNEYTDFTSQLRHYIFAPDINWGQTGRDVPKGMRTPLHMLGMLMNSSTFSASLTPEQESALHGAIQECLDVLDAEGGDIKERVNYVRYLLKRCLDILNGEQVDLFALRDLCFQATGAVTAVSLELPDETRKRFGNAFSQILVPWVMAATSSGAGGILTSVATAGLLGG